MNEEYKKHLESDWWQERRESILKEYNNECFICENKATCVHHLHYHLLLGQENKKQLIPLCYDCHKDIHNNCCKKKEWNFENTKGGKELW